MRTLIRSCIACNISDAPELLLQNLLALDRSGLVPEIREEQTIWDLIRSFARTHQHVPELPTLQAQLADAHDLTAIDYLAQMSRDPCKVRGDFTVFLERVVEQRRADNALELLRQARAVVATGLEVKGPRGTVATRQGVDDALAMLREGGRKLERAPSGVKISGEFLADVGDLRAEYQRAKMTPVTGNYCGLRQIDETLRGSKNRELWVHAAYSSHLKSTFALNWAYHLAAFFQSSSVFFSLEMNYEQCRRQLAAMHSFHFKFRDLRQRLGLQENEKTDTGLDYEKIRDGLLGPREEEFFDLVLADLEDERNQYGKIHVEAKDPNRPEFRVADIQARSEAIYAEAPFTKIFVDHTGLMDPREGSRYGTTTEKLNEVLKDLKSLARGFRGGAGTDVTILHQINRVGLATALKKKEAGKAPRYDMTNLSQTSGAEQHADVVSTSWVDDELRSKDLALFDCLKSRDGAPFAPFYANVRWPCRRILTSTEPFVEIPVAGTKGARRRQSQLSGTEIFNALNTPTSSAQEVN